MSPALLHVWHIASFAVKDEIVQLGKPQDYICRNNKIKILQHMGNTNHFQKITEFIKYP